MSRHHPRSVSGAHGQGQRAYLYYFTYADTGKRARLGAHHGEELFFLTDSFPSDWEHASTDQELGRIIRSYWVQFVRTGDPNLAGIPDWPAYDEHSCQYFELGSQLSRPVPERLRALEALMKQVVERGLLSRGN
jgi:para-nitrobenzyl esterase